MAKLTSAQIAEVKGQGFLINRGTQLFSGRIVPAGGVFSAKQLKVISDVAEKFGNGKIISTSRLAVEVTGIPYEKIQDAKTYLEKELDGELSFGGTGAKLRPVTSCKGTTCVYGNFDTQALAKKIHEDYYLGWADVKLPHKFKIAVGGCPNSCMKPSLNDFGVEGHKVPVFNEDLCHGCKICQVEKNCPVKASKVVDGKLFIDKNICLSCGVCTGKCPFRAVAHDTPVQYKIYVGGTWGKHTRMGSALSRFVNEEDILPILEKTILWFKENAREKERLGMAIDRIGFENFESAVLDSDDLLTRKEEILAKPFNE